MRSLRLASVALAVVALALSSAPARAGGLELPSWSGDEVILREGGLPAGWTVVGGEAKLAAVKEVDDVVDPILGEAKIDDLDVSKAGVVLRNEGGETVTVYLLDLDTTELNDVPAKVQAAAKAKGWHAQELATPLRLLVVTGPEGAREVVVRGQLRRGAGWLTERALQRLQADDARMRASSRRLLETALGLEPKASAPHAVLGLLLSNEASIVGQSGQEEKARAAFLEAAKEFRLAFAEGTVMPPPPPLAYKALSEFGLALLMQKTAEANAEAKKVLAKAVEIEQHGDATWIARYNLACAHSLLGEKEEGVKHMVVALQTMKATLSKEAMQQQIAHIAGDTDLDAIRDEPAFKEALEKAASSGADTGI
jgi:hypothetical protein